MAFRICQRLDVIRDGEALESQQLSEVVAIALTALAGEFMDRAPDLALMHFDMALTLVPELPAAMRGAAACHERLGRHGEALAIWDRLAGLYPDSVEIALYRERVASHLERQRGSDGAIATPPAIDASVIQMADMEADRDRPVASRIELLLREAKRAFDSGKLETALAFAQRSLALDESNADALSLIVRALPQHGRWADALPLVRTLARTHPEDARPIVNSLLTISAGAAPVWLLSAEIDAAAGDTRTAADCLRHIVPENSATSGDLVGAARFAEKIGLFEEASRLYRHALENYPSNHLILEMARFQTRAERFDDAIEMWSRLLEARETAVEAASNIGRIYGVLEKPQAIIDFVRDRGVQLFADIDRRTTWELNSIVRIFGRYQQSCISCDDRQSILWLIDLLNSVSPAGSRASFLRARLLDSLGRKSDAEEQLRLAGGDKSPQSAEESINAVGEWCLHNLRYGHFGKAYPHRDFITTASLNPESPYHHSFRVFADLLERDTLNEETLYPEDLLEEVVERSNPAAINYRAVPANVMMVVGSLGQGGGEKQTVTVLRRMLAQGDGAKLFLAIRTIDRRPSDDFFLATIQTMNLRWAVYGSDWNRVHRSSELLPELSNDQSLASAIDLLPHSAREELLRISRLILDQRPHTVHIWQDMPIVAVACVLCGVPRFFIHRGSLSPDYWQFNDYQWHTHFRPMQFVYRHLAHRQGFFFLNNCDVGCRTDANWIGVPRDDRFRVLYNAVEFNSLGAADGPNLTLRRELGIPDAAPVLGGSFRVVAVKRPLMWIETAWLVLRELPDAHFVIIGGGDLTDAVIAYAERQGFRARLHMPGRVNDVGSWYRIMDVMLLTSEREGIPNAIIEAQHFGVPVVATDVGGISEAIDLGRTGHAISDADPIRFAKAVTDILTDIVWRERARSLAPQFVHDRFSLEGVLSQLAGYYGWPSKSGCAE